MRTSKDKPISAQQLKALHATFHRIGMDDEARHGCIYESLPAVRKAVGS